MLGFIIFLIDAIFYTFYIFSLKDIKERSIFMEKLKYTVPIGLFMQVFFALIFVFTFKFLAVFKALDTTVGGGLYFSYVLFLPMLYMLFNNWLWLTPKKGTTYLNIFAWGVKLAICGMATPFI
jgi:hypothetical protein